MERATKEAALFLRDSLANLEQAAKQFRKELDDLLAEEGELERVHPDAIGRRAFVVQDRGATAERAAMTLCERLGGGK